MKAMPIKCNNLGIGCKISYEEVEHPSKHFLNQ